MHASYYSYLLLALQLCSAYVIKDGSSQNGDPVGAASVDWDNRHQSSRRAPLTCPEAIGGTPWTCSSTFCGGEDPSKTGFCKKPDATGSKCQCKTSGYTDSPVFTTITTTINGKTQTATYALQTIPSYTGLRQAITTTVTTTVTATTGGSSVETATGVILAGGVTWLLAGFAGDVAAAEALTPPADDPGHKDDPKCPNPKSRCNACGGKGEVCTTGSAVGCACEKSAVCPSDEPACADCNGKDGKCTSGDSNGCSCTEDTCPTEDDTFDCTECGGDNGKLNTCDGLPDKNGRWKGCDCVGITDRPGYQPPDNPTAAQINAAMAALPDFTPASYDLPVDIPVVCQNSNYVAPQSDVTKSINKWCSDVDGKTVTKSNEADLGAQFNMYRVSYYSYWLSATHWNLAPSSNKCSDTVTIKKEECIDVLTTAMTKCDPNSGQTHGASYEGQCIAYFITMDTGLDPQSPPWNRLDSLAQGSCNMDQSSGVQYNFWEGVYPQFCNEVDKAPTQSLTKDLTQNDFKPPPKSRSLEARTPPPSSGMYPAKYGSDWKFHFEFSGANGDCRKSCHDALSTLSDSPCGRTASQQNAMASFGSIDVGCGTYKYSITAPDPNETTCKIAQGSTPELPFSVEDATDAINKFCNDDKALVSNPIQPDTFLQNKFTDTTPRPFRNYLYGNTVITIFAAFADTVGVKTQDCAPDTDFKIKDGVEDCKNVLLKTIIRCNTNTQTEKKGSFTLEHEADHGCVVWQISAYDNSHH